MAARLQLHEHNNLTAKFLKREDNCRSVLGDHWKDKRVTFRTFTKHQLPVPVCRELQEMGLARIRRMQTICKALYPKQPAFAECLGHIQGYYKALQKPRIAEHHGIWRDQIRHIGKQSLEEHEDRSRIWTFPTSASAVKHEEWHMREILTHIGLMINTQIGRSDVGKEIASFHVTIGYWDADDFTDPKIQAFLKVRPDGVGFNVIARICAFLEYTSPMDSRDGASEQPDWYMGANWSLDWAQDKDLEEDTRYDRHFEYMRWASRRQGTTWTTAQYNFTVGVRGSSNETAWKDRLTKPGVNNAKTRDVIRRQAIRKTLELSDVILRQFHVARHTNPK